MDDQGTNRTGWGNLVLWTLGAAIPASFLGFILVSAWGISSQAGHSTTWTKLAGVVGISLLLPTVLLSYALGPFGGLGMAAEGVLAVAAQFLGYAGLVYGVLRFRDRGYQFGLRGLLITITVAAIILGFIVSFTNI